MIHHGDLFDVLPTLKANSIDACVTDPPYGLEFMGKDWDKLGATAEAFRESVDESGRVDYHGKGNAPFGCGGNRVRYGQSAKSMQDWHERWAREVYRVLKPGAHMLVMGAPRTAHRMIAGVEDAGFEIRDCLCWLFGQGFPKSLDIGKAIDKAAGAKREILGVREYAGGHVQQSSPDKMAPTIGTFVRTQDDRTETAPATDAAKQWNGWGTALKPAFEMIVLARKPFKGTVAENVLTHGTGGINVDACRIEHAGESLRGGNAINPNPGWNRPWMSDPEALKANELRRRLAEQTAQSLGRWPSNVLLDEQAAALLDEMSGELTSGSGLRRPNEWQSVNAYGFAKSVNGASDYERAGDSGGASRFFYVAKPSQAERDLGIYDLDPRERIGGGKFNRTRVCEVCGLTDNGSNDHSACGDAIVNQTAKPARNHHPTVKPIELMRWLIRLITPPGGTVLDPFCGSGTTGCAAAFELRPFVGVEREAEYVEIAKRRIAECAPLFQNV